MAKKEAKKFSINKLQKIAEENFENDIVIDYYGEQIHVKETIDFQSMMEFVSDVVSSVFLEDGNYIPEAVDFLVRSCVLRYYAGFNMPEDIGEHYRLVYETDAFDVIVQHINKAQFDDIVRSINKKLQYMCDTKVMSFADKMQKVLESFDELNGNMSKLMDGVDSTDIKNIANAVQDNGIREDMIVGAYIDSLKARKMPTYSGPVNNEVVGG